jgi:hypothetical protein
VRFHEGKLYRGQNRQKTATKSKGTLHGEAICTKVDTSRNDGGIPAVNQDLAARGHWVIIHAKSGKVCWTGKITNAGFGASVYFWDFEVENTRNDADNDPTSGDDTVTVTVVSPDNGPSNPTDTTASVNQVP